MNQYKYNEEEYAKIIESKGFLTQYHTYELTLLVKYWKKKGIKPKERKEKIYEFCKKHIEKFNEVKYFRKINYVLNKGNRKDNPLIIINNIPITDNEFKYINKSNIEYDYKKILFSLLVSMKIKKEILRQKYGNQSDFYFIGGTQKIFDEIFEMSKLPNNIYEINSIINMFENLGYVDVRTKGKINLLFMNEIEKSDVIVFEIITFDNIIYYFDFYNGDEKIIKCIDCGTFIKQSKNKHKKYCKICWINHRNNYQKELMRKIRNDR